MKLSYEEIKEWLWKSEYRYFVEFIEFQERLYPNLIADLIVYPDNSIRITMRDKTNYTWHSEANLPSKVESVIKRHLHVVKTI